MTNQHKDQPAGTESPALLEVLGSIGSRLEEEHNIDTFGKLLGTNDPTFHAITERALIAVLEMNLEGYSSAVTALVATFVSDNEREPDEFMIPEVFAQAAGVMCASVGLIHNARCHQDRMDGQDILEILRETHFGRVADRLEALGPQECTRHKID